jgi:hypothetical protein
VDFSPIRRLLFIPSSRPSDVSPILENLGFCEAMAIAKNIYVGSIEISPWRSGAVHKAAGLMRLRIKMPQRAVRWL